MDEIRRKTALTDQPCITMTQAAFLFGMGHRLFRQKFTEFYQFEIDWVYNRHSRKLLLIDCIKLAFPDASKKTQYLLAQDFIYRLPDIRRKLRRNGSKNGGNTE